MRRLRDGVSLAVLFSLLSRTLRVTFASFETLSDFTLAGVLNEGLRALIFVFWRANLVSSNLLVVAVYGS